MKKLLAGVLMAGCLVGCTGAEVMAWSAGTATLVKALLMTTDKPAEPVEAPVDVPAPQEASKGLPDILGAVGKAMAPLSGLPGGQVFSGIGGVLVLLSWVLTRRRVA